MGDAGEAARRQPVAERETSEEDREHAGDRLGRGAEGEAEQSRPDQLVDQRGEPREEQTRDDGEMLQAPLPPEARGPDAEQRIGNVPLSLERERRFSSPRAATR